MLTEQQILTADKSRKLVLGPALTVAVLGVFGYFAVIPLFGRDWLDALRLQFGGSVADLSAMLVIISGAFAVILVPILIAERYVKRFSICCPSCSDDVTLKILGLLATRRCPECGDRIVAGGRVRSWAVYKRHCRIKWRRFLMYWLWAWPGSGAAFLIFSWFDPTAIVRIPEALLITQLVGVGAAGWAWGRTFDIRYLPQIVASGILLIVGAAAFWQSI